MHFDWGDVKIIPAWHTTANVPLGMATGLALTIEGKLIYIAGDTGLFSDMKLVGRKQQRLVEALLKLDHLPGHILYNGS